MKRSRGRARLEYVLVGWLFPVACSLSLPDETEFFGPNGGSSSTGARSSGGEAAGGLAAGAGFGGRAPSGGQPADGGADSGGMGGDSGGMGGDSGGMAGSAGRAGQSGSGGRPTTGGTSGISGAGAGGAAGGDAGGGPGLDGGAGGQGGVPTVDPFDPLAGLILHYRFEEATGSAVADATSVHNDGVANGTVTWAEPGKVGNALHLSGQAAYVSVPATLLTGRDEATFSIWFNQDQRVLWTRVLDFGSSQTHWMYFAPATVQVGEPGARASLDVANFITAELHMPSVLPGVAEWMHLTITWQKTRFACYVNGALVDEDAAPVYSPAEFVNLTPSGETWRGWIGRSSFSADPYFVGKVDEFRVYDHALSAPQVAALHALEQ